jgi:hypothetical protein
MDIIEKLQSCTNPDELVYCYNDYINQNVSKVDSSTLQNVVSTFRKHLKQLRDKQQKGE